METFSALLVLCEVEFPSQRPATRSFGVFFDLRLNKWLNKPSRRRWFETPSRPLWCRGNDSSVSSPEILVQWKDEYGLFYCRQAHRSQSSCSVLQCAFILQHLACSPRKLVLVGRKSLAGSSTRKLESVKNSTGVVVSRMATILKPRRRVKRNAEGK